MEVRLENVTHIYEGNDESGTVQVLDDVSLTIPDGAFMVLRGASGSGKSTLLNLIGAVDRPTRGRVFLGTEETSSLSEAALTQLRRTRLGFVFQFFNLIPTLSVFENVGFPLSLAARPRHEIRTEVERFLREVGLSHRARHYPNELSGGEMQRVAIARALVHKPRLLLADEPTGNLDSKNGMEVLSIIRDMHATLRPTIVMATHSDAAAAYGESVVEIADGRIVSQSGSIH